MLVGRLLLLMGGGWEDSSSLNEEKVVRPLAFSVRRSSFSLCCSLKRCDLRSARNNSHHREIDPRKFTDAPGAYNDLSDQFIGGDTELTLSIVEARRSIVRAGNSEDTSSFVYRIESSKSCTATNVFCKFTIDRLAMWVYYSVPPFFFSELTRG
jgi:hypothetical protein